MIFGGMSFCLFRSNMSVEWIIDACVVWNVKMTYVEVFFFSYVHVNLLDVRCNFLKQCYGGRNYSLRLGDVFQATMAMGKTRLLSEGKSKMEV